MQIPKTIYPTRKEKSPGFIMPSVDSLMKQALCIVRRGQYFLWRDDEIIFIKKSR